MVVLNESNDSEAPYSTHPTVATTTIEIVDNTTRRSKDLLMTSSSPQEDQELLPFSLETGDEDDDRVDRGEDEESEMEEISSSSEIALASRLRWADQVPGGDCSLVTVMQESEDNRCCDQFQQEQQQQQQESIRIAILLLDSASKQYEFVNGEMLTQKRLLVSDLLDQLSSLAGESSIWSKCHFVSLYISHENTVPKELGLNTSLSDCELYNGDILTAIAAPPSSLEEESMSFILWKTVVLKTAQCLLTKKVRKRVKQACLVGRSLRTIYSSKEWEAVSSSSPGSETTGAKPVRETTSEKKKKKRKKDRANVVWIGILLLHPSTQQFELLHCQYYGNSSSCRQRDALRVSDVLAQLPGMARSRPTFTNVTFSVLLADPSPHAELLPDTTLQDGNVQSGDVLIALVPTTTTKMKTTTNLLSPSCSARSDDLNSSSSSNMMTEATALDRTLRFLKKSHKMFRSMVRRAYKANKKDREVLLNSEQWASVLRSSSSSASLASSSASFLSTSTNLPLLGADMHTTTTDARDDVVLVLHENENVNNRLEQQDTLLSPEQFEALMATQPKALVCSKKKKKKNQQLEGGCSKNGKAANTWNAPTNHRLQQHDSMRPATRQTEQPQILLERAVEPVFRTFADDDNKPSTARTKWTDTSVRCYGPSPLASHEQNGISNADHEEGPQSDEDDDLHNDGHIVSICQLEPRLPPLNGTSSVTGRGASSRPARIFGTKLPLALGKRPLVKQR